MPSPWGKSRMNFKSIRFRVTAIILMCATVGVVLFETFWLPRLNQVLTDTQTRELEKGRLNPV